MSTTADKAVTTALEEFDQFLEAYEHNPVAFVREIWHVEPDVWQQEVLQQVFSGTRKISIRSGHGVGKSTTAAWVCIIALLVAFPVKIVLTAPSSAQLNDALFAEVQKWINKLPDSLKNMLKVTSDRVVHLSAPAESFIAVRTSRAEQPDALQGIHAADGWVILIVDEASGVPESVFEAASGSMAQEKATTIMLGNPVRSTGYFYETQTKLKDHWYTRRVSAADSPRVPQSWIDEMALRYGRESNAFRIRVEGEFPKGDDDTVIPAELIDTAKMRDVMNSPNTAEIWGLDVARFGSDSSALAKRKGRVLVEAVRRYQGLDLMQLSGAVYAEYTGLAENKRPVEILVDAIGMGAGVVDRLHELGLPVRGINVSESPSVGNTYLNLRAELWYKARAWFAGRDVSIPNDEQLAKELATVRYKFTERGGKLQIESKDDIRKRMPEMGSPDSADALILTFASDETTLLRGSNGSLQWNKPLRRNLKGIV